MRAHVRKLFVTPSSKLLDEAVRTARSHTRDRSRFRSWDDRSLGSPFFFPSDKCAFDGSWMDSDSKLLAKGRDQILFASVSRPPLLDKIEHFVAALVGTLGTPSFGDKACDPLRPECRPSVVEALPARPEGARDFCDRSLVHPMAT